MADFAAAMGALCAAWQQMRGTDWTATLSYYLAEPKMILPALRTVDLFVLLVAAMVLFAAYAFIGSNLTGDTSYVDRQWSFVPMVYCWICAWHSNWSTRSVVIAVLVSVWGLRLSYNFWRKGGYSGEEDYRWAVLRQHPVLGNRFVWFLFNLLFVSVYQHVLLLAFTLPAYYASVMSQQAPFGNWLDILVASLFLFFVLLETIADQQQWTFQTEKHRRLRLAKMYRSESAKLLKGDYKRGFCTRGLFSWSRHPNFFAEQAVWASFYLFTPAASAGHVLLHWTIAGCVALVLLFQGSTQFTEQISCSKYPAYCDYQRSTSRLLPLPGSCKLKDE